MKLADQIRAAIKEGKKIPDITRQFGVAASTVAYHRKQLGEQKYTFSRKLIDWNVAQNLYDQGNTYKEICTKLNCNESSLRRGIKRGLLTPMPSTLRAAQLKASRGLSPRGRNVCNDAEIFCIDSKVSSTVLRKRCRKGDVILPGCQNDQCPHYMVAEPVWAGKLLVLQLDHVNGKRDDNRISNLRWLCPNCHSQTNTYCGRNNQRRSAG